MLTTFDVAMCAAREAGTILSRAFNEGFSVRLKGVADLVTDADVASERRIAAVIREAFPDHSILGEEENSADTNVEHLWVVDPLDGTTNFAHHIPHFAVSIAYFHHGKVECGVILNPIRDDLYVARRGYGATHNGQQPALLLGIALGISFNMGKNSIFFWKWNPECLDSHWKNRLFKK